GERDGVDYFFLSDDEFSRRVAAGEFLEWAEYCGYRYGTPRRSIERLLSEGKTVILDIDTQGAQQIREKMPEGVFVFLLPPSWEELRKRIQQRGTESPATATARLRLAAREADAITQYDYYIVNDDPDRAASELEAIIRAERCRVRRFSHRAWLQRFRTEAAALGAEEGEG
ncbi:MAG TPA: guanylate kinase, partial [Limnochordia bacterium]